VEFRTQGSGFRIDNGTYALGVCHLSGVGSSTSRTVAATLRATAPATTPLTNARPNEAVAAMEPSPKVCGERLGFRYQGFRFTV
jgi:hypothetical protein